MTITLTSISPIALPPHGHIACRRCFTADGPSQMIGKWQMVNDPTAWGSTTPVILILGFSKGFTQANAFHSGRLEDDVEGVTGISRRVSSNCR